MTAEELENILEAHSKWLNGEEDGIRANLRYADLRYAGLRGADLSGADLRGANLSRVNLSSADLSSADLSGADLRGANLRYANLRYADLIDANLSGANLRYADLSRVNLSSADLSGADLIDAGLSGAIGNNREVKTLQLGKYNTTILVGVKIHIGCQTHTIEKWENFTDEEISKMDNRALEWWKEWKDFILKVAKDK